ncbi:MAG: hypothetical protein AAFQ66_01190 [Pseudomonadota bacterium]
MRILNTKIADARWIQGDQRVQADIDVVIQPFPGAELLRRTLLVSVPARAPQSEGRLRDRLMRQGEIFAHFV